MAYRISQMRCDSRVEPLGIDTQKPVFGWKLADEKNDVRQVSYRIVVRDAQASLWDTGVVYSDDSTFVTYAGQALESGKKYTWELWSKSNEGDTAQGSSTFETAYMHAEDWRAKWVIPAQRPAYREPKKDKRDATGGGVPLEEIRMEPGRLLRKGFTLSGPVKSARANITAHGLYRLSINGGRVGDIQLAPGSTSYHKYLEYQTYDITEHVHPGENALCVCLTDGWYTGKHGFIGRSCPFGDKLAALFQLEIEYADGTRERVISDETCKSVKSDIDYADLFVGQRQDARRTPAGCDLPGYDERGWDPVEIADYGLANLRAQYGEPVRIVEVRRPAHVFRAPNGEWILDVGQVVAGRLRVRVRGARGTVVTFEHSETVDPNGDFFQNIRGFFCKQIDTYVLAGNGIEVFDPEFTYHGFQYVRIMGYPGIPTVDDFDVLVIASDLEVTGDFSCSDERLNRLQRNIFQSQRGNMVSVPTDCPQREKSAWTGDAQIYAPTACFNMHMLAFFRRWLRNIRLDQMPDGQIPVVVPYIEAYYPNGFFFYDTHTSAAWGDAAILLPWALYQAYGDEEILRENYDMMKRWLGYVQKTAEEEIPEDLAGELTPERSEWQKYLWNTHFHFGDWLAPSVCFDPKTGDIDLARSAFETMDIVPTCFYAGTTKLMSEIACILGRDDDAQYYANLNERIRDAFAREYLDADGYIVKRLQGVYVLAIQMGLLKGELLGKNLKRLINMIEENGHRLDTGFVSVPYLLSVLSYHGEWETASRLLMQEECPSWLYMVKMGASTIWEAWQAILPDGSKTSVSYNHYALGCVGSFLYRKIGGLEAEMPGYKRILFDPRPMGGITSARTFLETEYGCAGIEWTLTEGKMEIYMTVPVNTTATVVVRGTHTELDGRPLDGRESIVISSGSHRLAYDLL